MRSTLFAVPFVLYLPFIASAQSKLVPDHANTRAFNRALGVECTHCHVQDQWKDETKPAFATAPNMLRMVQTVNDKLKGVGQVSCVNLSWRAVPSLPAAARRA